MDSGQLIQNSGQSVGQHTQQPQKQRQQQQQQQQQQQHPGPDQLPDESYIEKLFPKCQPKLSNQTRGAKRLTRPTDRQQQQQQQRRHLRNKKLYQQSRNALEGPGGQGEAASMASGNAISVGTKALSKSRNSAKHQQHFELSDSSHDESHGRLGSTNGSVRRSGSNQFGFDATSGTLAGEQLNGLEQTTSKVSGVAYSKPSTKKYRASKNLQQKLSRSQSNQSKLSQVLQIEQRGLPNLDTHPDVSGQQRATLGASRSEVSTSQDNGAVNGRKLERGNRTRRGIVFAEPLPGSQPGLAEGEFGPPKESSERPGSFESGPVGKPHDRVDLLSSQGCEQAPRSPPQAGQEQASLVERKTADVDSTSIGDEPKVAQDEVAATDGDSYHTFEADIQDPIVDLKRPLPIESSLGNLEADQGDDDKFINLFVYDQTLTASAQDAEPGHVDVVAPELFTHEQSEKDPDNTTEDCKPELRGRFLDASFGDHEQGVISNDTSIEELCASNENGTDISFKKKFPRARPTVEGELSFEVSQQEKHEQDNVTFGNLNKSTLKHHRPIGTLQTVDEKAEISIENDYRGLEHNQKTDLIDISENNTMLSGRDESSATRKGFVPPGFPQRVRPAPRAPTSDISHPTTATRSMNTSLVAISPSDGSPTSSAPIEQPTLRETKNPEPGRFDNQVERHGEFTIATESQSVVEKNLSEALSKVTLDQVVTDNLKNALLNTNPRHHRIPNEASHFSAVQAPVAKTNELPTSSGVRSGSLFQTLSDNESEENMTAGMRLGKISNAAPMRVPLKRQDTPANSFRPGILRPSSARPVAEPTQAAKTALVFPRLDEGLSSDAESDEEEAEDDDDKAMEADVEADDDDDEDEDDDDADEEADNQNRITGNSQVVSQAGVETFFRHPQFMKPRDRPMGSLQQNVGLQTQDSDVQNVKAHIPTYANFSVNDDQIGRAELKPLSNHTGQNGIQSNCWIGPAATSSQAIMSSQPTPSSSHFSNHRSLFSNSNSNSNNSNSNISNIINNNNNNNNNSGSSNNSNSNNANSIAVNNSSSSNINLSRSNSYGNRDDAKAANRLSSDTDNETDRLLGTQRNDQLQKMTSGEQIASGMQTSEQQAVQSFPSKHMANSKEVLIEGVMFPVKYLGSTHTECEGRGEKEDRIRQAELAVHEVKFRNGELQQPEEVQLFISTEKIMVLDDKKKVIMMDHSLRTISYIADIGDAIVLIVRKKSSSLDAGACDTGRPMSKTSCHVFESHESHTITKSISQAFQVAYTELLKANGGGLGGDVNSYPKEQDYQEVLNSQEMCMSELEMFTCKENHREVIVPKKEGELLGLDIVESGWGSLLPTPVIASLLQDGPAYRCKKLSIGDVILSVNGISLVGPDLARCQEILRETKSQTVARLTVVPCPITVEVKIKRPDTKYQLGFSVQHGVICSLLRGGIAERGGVRVGHRIISINGTTVVGVPHDKIVTLLASSVGEIRMKTCLTSLYRHMLGEEKKHKWV